MKLLIVLVAAVALVSAAEEKKPVKGENGQGGQQKPANDNKPANENKPANANENDNKPSAQGVQWPVPDPNSEGDLILHGMISFDRVQALHKAKVEEEADKMILAHGRDFLRRVSKFFDDNNDFKIPAILCRDLRNLNGTENRWRIEIPKQASPAEGKEQQQPQQQKGENNQEQPQNDQPAEPEKDKEDVPRNNNKNITNENETSTSGGPSSSGAPSSTSAPSSSVSPGSSSSASSSSSAGSTSQPLTTIKPLADSAQPVQTGNYQEQAREFYAELGANLARLLMKEYRKEQLATEEVDYLARWVDEEAVHYGAMGIYCNEGENVKDIKKQLSIFLEEKAN